MDLQQIKTFLYVAREFSFSKAAQELFVSQPTISERVRSLEEELGIILFERTPREVRLTTEGKKFLPYAERCIDSLLEGINMIQAEKDFVNFHLGVVNPFWTFPLPYLLPKIYSEFPEINFHLNRQVYSPKIVDMVSNDRLDIGFINTVTQSNSTIKCVPLYKERLILVSNINHPLTQGSEIFASDLKNHRIITVNPRSNLSIKTQEYLSSNKVYPQSMIEINNIAAIKELLKQKPLLSILPEYLITNEIKNGELSQILLSTPLPSLTSSIVYKCNFQRMDVLNVVIDEVHKIINQVKKLP